MRGLSFLRRPRKDVRLSSSMSKYTLCYGFTNPLFLSMGMYDTYAGIIRYHGLVYGLHVSCSAAPYAVKYMPYGVLISVSVGRQSMIIPDAPIFARLDRSCPTYIHTSALPIIGHGQAERLHLGWLTRCTSKHDVTLGAYRF